MSATRNTIAATALAGVLSVVGIGIVSAHPTEPPSSIAILKPISGQGTAPDQTFLLTLNIGEKQTISYFENEDGRCKLTVMVGEAFNGEDVPDETAVRFETKIAPSRTALFDTAQGKGLEFKCSEEAQAMTVRAFNQIAGYGAAM